MLKEDEVFRRLAQAACPYCLQSDYDLRLRCDLGLGECIYVAMCGPCRRSFDFENIPTIDRLMGDLQKRASTATCPVCHCTGLEVGFVCLVGQRTCYAEICCPRGDFRRRTDGMPSHWPL